MYKLLIVDDNQTHIDCVLNFLDWDKLNFTEIKTAKNGISALNIFKSFNPDLIITDVVMPLCNGIELSNKIRQLDSNVHIIFMSCYEDFSYVKHAIDNDITAYILKPIDPDNLKETVEKTISSIRKRTQTDINERVISEFMPLVQDGILYRLLYHENPDLSEELLASAGFIQGNSSLVIKCAIIENINYTTKLYELSDVFKQIFINFDANIIIEAPNKVVILLSSPDVNKKALLETVTNELHIFMNETKNTFNLEFAAGISSIYDTVKKANTMLNQATLALENAQFLEADEIYLYDDIYYTIEENLTTKSDSPEEKGTGNIIVQNIKGYINANFKDITSVKQIATQLFISTGYAKNIFKKITGQTIFDYLVERRIKEAKKLLSNPTNKVYEVSELVGYTSKAHFTETFKKRTGMTPKEYQQHHLKE